MSKNEGFVNRYTQTATTLLQALDQAQALDAEYTAGDLGNKLTDEDTAGQELTKAQFIDGISAVRQVIATAKANATNLYALKQG